MENGISTDNDFDIMKIKEETKKFRKNCFRQPCRKKGIF